MLIPTIIKKNGQATFINLPHSRRAIPSPPITTPYVGVKRFSVPLANEKEAILPETPAVPAAA